MTILGSLLGLKKGNNNTFNPLKNELKQISELCNSLEKDITELKIKYDTAISLYKKSQSLKSTDKNKSVIDLQSLRMFKEYSQKLSSSSIIIRELEKLTQKVITNSKIDSDKKSVNRATKIIEEYEKIKGKPVHLLGI